MADDDRAGAGTPTSVPPSPRLSAAGGGRRRSTAELPAYDDDALAEALAEESIRLGLTGSISVVGPELVARDVPEPVVTEAPVEKPAETTVPPRDESPAPADAAASEPLPVIRTRPALHRAQVGGVPVPKAVVPEPVVLESVVPESVMPEPVMSELPTEPELLVEPEAPSAAQTPAPPVAAIVVPAAWASIVPSASDYSTPVLDSLADTTAAPASRFAFDDLVTGASVPAQTVIPTPETATSETTAPEPAFYSSTNSGVIEGVVPLDIGPRVRQPLLELVGIEPTSSDLRVGRSARLFWLWFATNSSVLSLGFGGALFSLGMSLRQAIVAAFLGVVLSFLPLGLGTLAGKWSGQPTMVLSRATFGLIGNLLPALLAVVTRLFWGAVLLWLIASSTARILVGASLSGDLTEPQLTSVALAIAALIVLVAAFLGYTVVSRLQYVFSGLSVVLIIGFIVATSSSVNIHAALTVGDGPWILVVTGIVLVFSFVGLVWASSSADLARYQDPKSSGAASMLWAPFGATLPAFVLIVYGAVLAASSPTVAKGLTRAPLDTIAALLPSWYPVPLIAATVVSLLSGVILSIYSGGFALQSLGVRIQRTSATVLAGLILIALAVVLALSVSSTTEIFRDLATSLAVPVAAWAGIFAAEMIIRRPRFDSRALLTRGGVYRDVNWINLGMLVVASAIGFGFSSATVSWLSWEGYFFTLFNVPLGSTLASTDLGVLIALAIGIVTPFVTGVPNIRRQERGARAHV